MLKNIQGGKMIVVTSGFMAVQKAIQLAKQRIKSKEIETVCYNPKEDKVTVEFPETPVSTITVRKIQNTYLIITPYCRFTSCSKVFETVYDIPKLIYEQLKHPKDIRIHKNSLLVDVKNPFYVPTQPHLILLSVEKSDNLYLIDTPYLEFYTTDIPEEIKQILEG